MTTFKERVIITTQFFALSQSVLLTLALVNAYSYFIRPIDVTLVTMIVAFGFGIGELIFFAFVIKHYNSIPFQDTQPHPPLKEFIV